MVKLIGAKFEEKDAELVKEVCKERGEDVSDFVRRSVKKELASLSYLSDETKKALGVPVSNGSVNETVEELNNNRGEDNE